MGLIDQAKQDIADITGNSDDFGVPMTLTAPGGQTIDIIGLHTKIHMAHDTDGVLVNSRKAHISFAESIAEGYPVRDGSGEVNLKGHTVTVQDSTGTPVTYVIREWFPDETVGLIACILGDFE